MSEPAENGRRVGRPFKKGQSGNPGGRPRGISTSARKILEEAAERAKLGEGPDVLTRFWAGIMADPTHDIKVRIHASELLAERAYGKAPQYAPVEGEDPLGLEEDALNAAVREFRAEVIRLAPAPGTGEAASSNGA